MRLIQGIKVALACAAMHTTLALAQNYPTRTVHLYTSEAGGGTDFVARLVAQGIAGPLGQSVVVDNRPNIISPALVAHATPDGYSLLLSSSLLWILPLLHQYDYDAFTDFSPMSMVCQAPLLLVVNPSVPAKSVSELIALARAKPGTINFASAGVATPTHLAGELFESMANVKMTHVPYKGSGLVLGAILGGQVQVYFGPGSFMQYVNEGKLRALGVTTAKPSPLLPGVPTVASTVPGYEASTNSVMLAPAKTPRPVIDRVNAEIAKMLAQPDTVKKLTAAGVEGVRGSPEELAAIMKADVASMSKLIKEAGIHAD